jgi:uncharacterized protein (TIGR00369 family)
MADDTSAPPPWQPLDGWDRVLGLRILRASGDEVVAEYEVDERHHQAYGIVHGGVHCSAIESVCSTGAGIHALSRGQSVVGLDNNTSFVRAVRSGKITVRATPITRGRRSQLWEAVARDEDGRIVSSGRVRLICLEPGSDLGGEPVGVKRG